MVDVTGEWPIPGVPDGKHVVLGACENDFLVRDPDTTIGGTDDQRLTGSCSSTPRSFETTGALDVVFPG